MAKGTKSFSTVMSTNPSSHPPLTDAQRRWLRAANALSPEESLARAASNGRFLVTLVVVISSLLTGFGAIALNLATLDVWPRRALVLVVLLVTSALLLALSSLVLRTRTVAVGDLLDVERWYQEEFRRMRRIAAAGWILIAAILVSGLLGAYLVWTAAPADATPGAPADASASRTWHRAGVAGTMNLAIHAESGWQRVWKVRSDPKGRPSNWAYPLT